MEEKRGRIRAIDELAPQVRRIDVGMIHPASVRPRAGQFVSVRLGPGLFPRRSYSIASPPTRTDGFELLAKAAGGAGGVFVEGLAVGDELSFFGPMGYFVCDEHHDGDVVLAATGAGISAIMSMAAELIARDERGRVLLYWGLRHERDLFWRERLDELARSPRFGYELYLSEPAPDWRQGVGHITGAVIASAGVLESPVYYLCGSGEMIHQVQDGLAARNIGRHRVRTEVFYPAALRR